MACGLCADPVIRATPASLTFSHQTGVSALPASQTVSLAAISSATAAMPFIATVGGAPWLIVTTDRGATPARLTVVVNPTTLAAGTYAATITVTPMSGDVLIVPVTLTVRTAPGTLTATPSMIGFTWRRGDGAPAPQAVNLTGNDALLNYSAAVMAAPWLVVTPASGFVFPAFATPLTVTAIPGELVPGTYRGTLALTSTNATNRTQTVTVDLTVQPGPPVISTVWPLRITRGAGDTTITLTGSHFYAASVVGAGTTALRSTFLGTTAMTAVVPQALLATAGTLALTVVNAAPGGTSPAAAFTIDPNGPRIAAVVDSASYIPGAISPGEILTVFGSGLGPDALAVFTLPLAGTPIATTLAGTRVLFNGTPAPVLYASAKQVSVVAPFGLATGAANVVVETNGVQSAVAPVTVTAASPALFTLNGSGTGQAAAFNYNDTTNSYSLNSETNGVAKGSIVILYGTGRGQTTPPSTDGQIVTSASVPPVAANMAVSIGGVAATLLYAGAAPGLVAGAFQVNARVPAAASTGKAVPVVVTIGTAPSTPVTIAVK